MNDYIEDFVEDESAASSDLFDCDYTPIDAVVNQSLCLPGVPHAQLKTETVWLSLMARELPNQHFSQTARN